MAVPSAPCADHGWCAPRAGSVSPGGRPGPRTLGHRDRHLPRGVPSLSALPASSARRGRSVTNASADVPSAGTQSRVTQGQGQWSVFVEEGGHGDPLLKPEPSRVPAPSLTPSNLLKGTPCKFHLRDNLVQVAFGWDRDRVLPRALHDRSTAGTSDSHVPRRYESSL